jgi:hypothetical protein
MIMLAMRVIKESLTKERITEIRDVIKTQDATKIESGEELFKRSQSDIFRSLQDAVLPCFDQAGVAHYNTDIPIIISLWTSFVARNSNKF